MKTLDWEWHNLYAKDLSAEVSARSKLLLVSLVAGELFGREDVPELHDAHPPGRT